MPMLEQVLGSATQSDLLLLFYAGHGKLDRSGRLCLATADTQRGAFYSTSIPAAELRNLIANSSCGAVILLLDCCYSGAAGREFTRGSVDDQLTQMQEAQGLHVLTASTAYQTARELESEPGAAVMGKFTHAIFEGVKSGSADCDRDGLITLSDLRRYLSEVLRGQTPQYFAQSAAGDPPIARARPVETPLEKRKRRLGEWYADGEIPDESYEEIFPAACGMGDAKVVMMIQRLVDNPNTTAAALIAAWKGAVRRAVLAPLPQTSTGAAQSATSPVGGRPTSSYKTSNRFGPSVGWHRAGRRKVERAVATMALALGRGSAREGCQ